MVAILPANHTESERSSNSFGKSVQIGFCGLLAVACAEMQPEAVSGEMRKHVQVNMENLLPRHFVVCKNQIHAITENNATSERS